MSNDEIDALIESHRDDAPYHIEDHFEVFTALTQLREQRDALLDALCECEGYLADCDNWSGDVDGARERARAAIQKATGASPNHG